MPDVVRDQFFLPAGVDLSGTIATPSNEQFVVGQLFVEGLETAAPSGDPDVPVVQLPSAPVMLSNHYLFDFYNRIYLFPSFIDFGAITADETQTFNIWNAYFTSKMMTGVTEPLDTSVAVDTPTPTTFAALELRSFGATAFASGPAKLNGTFTFNFSAAEPVTLEVRGTRAELWPFQPNWTTPPRVKVEYRTEIITSRSGKEQRRAQRISPRKEIEFDVLVKGDAYIDLKRLLTRWQNKSFIVPDFTRSVTLMSAVPSGATVIPTGTLPWWAVPGMDVIIQTPESPYKWRQAVHGILSVAGSNITLADATTSDWPAGSTICPVVMSLAQPEMTVNPRTSTLADVTVRFSVDPGSEPQTLYPDSLPIFDDREVLTWRTNWRDSPVTNFIYPMEQIDYGRGRIETIRPIAFPSATRRISMLAKSSAEAQRYLAQFMRMRGQRGEFWADSGEPDLIPFGNTPSGNNIITVEGGDFFDTYSQSTVYKALQFVMRDGTVHRTKILGMAMNAGNTDVTIETSLNQPVNEATVDRISWLRLCRHATDEMTLDWVTDSVVETQITVRTLEVNDAE